MEWIWARLGFKWELQVWRMRGGLQTELKKTWRKVLGRKEQVSLETMAHAMSTLLYVKINCSAHMIPIFYHNEQSLSWLQHWCMFMALVFLCWEMCTWILFDCRGMLSRRDLCCSESVSQTFVSVADKSGAGAQCNTNRVEHWPVWSDMWDVLITTVNESKACR